jgi:hypothetical protein
VKNSEFLLSKIEGNINRSADLNLIQFGVGSLIGFITILLTIATVSALLFPQSWPIILSGVIVLLLVVVFLSRYVHRLMRLKGECLKGLQFEIYFHRDTINFLPPSDFKEISEIIDEVDRSESRDQTFYDGRKNKVLSLIEGKDDISKEPHHKEESGDKRNHIPGDGLTDLARRFRTLRGLIPLVLILILGTSMALYGYSAYAQATSPIASPSFESNYGITLSYFGSHSLENVSCFLEFTPRSLPIDAFTLRVHFEGNFVANETYTFIFSTYPFDGNISRIVFSSTRNVTETNFTSFELTNLPISEVDGIRTMHLAFNHENPETVIYYGIFYLSANDSVVSYNPNISNITFTANTQQINFEPVLNAGSITLSYSDFNDLTSNHNFMQTGLLFITIGLGLIVTTISVSLGLIRRTIHEFTLDSNMSVGSGRLAGD